MRRDDGIAYPPIYAEQFFYPEGLPEPDEIAVGRCTGRVPDIGAGAGSHSLAIQNRGLEVTSVDISAKAVQVMRSRGCRDAGVGDVFDSYSEPFDTVLVILNIGIVRNLDGLARFLKHPDRLMTDDGRLITDSIDPRNSEDESYRKYTQEKIAKGCYLGERTLRFEYKDKVSDWFEWMHVDPETKLKIEDWGRVETIRAFYKNSFEVEYNFTESDWADVPVDSGTYRVVSDGMKILYDAKGVFGVLQKALLSENCVKGQAQPNKLSGTSAKPRLS